MYFRVRSRDEILSRAEMTSYYAMERFELVKQVVFMRTNWSLVRLVYSLHVVNSKNQFRACGGDKLVMRSIVRMSRWLGCLVSV